MCLWRALVKFCVCPPFPFGVEGGMWDVIVLIPDDFLSIFYFALEHLRNQDLACERHILINNDGIFVPLISLRDDDIDIMNTTYNTAVADTASETCVAWKKHRQEMFSTSMMEGGI